jgi:hypothetical protein
MACSKRTLHLLKSRSKAVIIPAMNYSTPLTPSQVTVVERFRAAFPATRVCRRSSSRGAHVHIPMGPARLIAHVGPKGGTSFEIPNLAEIASDEDAALEFATALTATRFSAFASEFADA